MKKFLIGAVAINLGLIWLVLSHSINQFYVFAIWLIVFILLNLYLLGVIFRKIKFDWRNYLKSILPGLLIVLALTILPRLFLQGIYPHVSQWDELRDAGLYGQRIGTDNVKIFGFGAYEGYGNFVGLSSYYAQMIFGQTSLSYTVPALIYGTLAVLLFYMVLAKYKSQRFAVFTSIVYSVSLSQLQFSRADVCLITDAFIAMLLFIAALLAKRNILGYLILGLVAGLTWHYYAGSRLVLLCLLIILACYQLKGAYVNFKLKNLKPSFDQITKSLAYFCVGLFISLGPTLLYLNSSTLISSHGVSLWLFNNADFLSHSFFGQIQIIFDLYQQSFFAYINTPVHGFNINFSIMPTALLAFPLNYFFIIGLFTIVLLKRNIFNKMVLLIVVMFPFFSQVLPDKVAYVHRLQGLIPFANVIAAIGMFELFRRIIANKKTRNIVMIILVAIFYLCQLKIFFIDRMADEIYNKRLGDYSFQFALNDIAKEPVGKNYYILDKIPYDFSPLLYNEKIEYLTSPHYVKILSAAQFQEKISKSLKAGPIDNNDVFISFTSKPNINIITSSTIINFKEVKYTCNQRILGVLYDCPNNTKAYSYYVFTVASQNN